MQWIPYSLAAAVGFALWAFFGKIALRHASWAQVGLVYGVATALLFGALLLGPARRGFAGTNGWALAAGAISGALGLTMFYLALDHGKASIVVPLVSVYPLITAGLAIVFLSESLTVLQMVGVGCTLGGVVLIGVAR